MNNRRSRCERARRAAAWLALVFAPTVAAEPADWFPAPPDLPRYQWQPAACGNCVALDAPSTWKRMAELAGVPGAHFVVALTDVEQAVSLAPDIVVIAPALFKLGVCQQAFVIGHELAHLARRHFDAEAVAVLTQSGRPPHWTASGNAALQLLDGDYRLVMQLSRVWQAQEHEADRLGSLLAAQAGGCELVAGALAFLGAEADNEAGLYLTHASARQRIAELLPFAERVRALVAQRAPDRLTTR